MNSSSNSPVLSILTAKKPNGKDVVSSEVFGDPKSKKPNGKSVDSSAEPLCSMTKKEDVVSIGDLPTFISDSNEQLSICFDGQYPGDDIPGAGAVTTKLSQGVTREAPETSIGMVEGTTTATAVLPLEPLPSGFTAERSPLQEDTLLLFLSPFSFLAHCEILIHMFTN
ncbi:hypothetical protein Bca101_043845 [Brassica carinata]